jgi:hypothetical protein
MRPTTQTVEERFNSEWLPDQAVMSAVTSSEIPAKISVSAHVRDRLFTFGCDVLLVFHWSISR